MLLQKIKTAQKAMLPRQKFLRSSARSDHIAIQTKLILLQLQTYINAYDPRINSTTGPSAAKYGSDTGGQITNMAGVISAEVRRRFGSGLFAGRSRIQHQRYGGDWPVIIENCIREHAHNKCQTGLSSTMCTLCGLTVSGPMFENSPIRPNSEREVARAGLAIAVQCGKQTFAL